MKKTFTLFLFTSTFYFSQPTPILAQCGAGYTQSQLNWDFLDYLVSTGTYSGFVSNAIAGNQNFVMGTTRLNIRAATPSFTLGGENAMHTGELAGYQGQDVQYTPTVNGDSIVITFSRDVTNARFALYDIDNAATFTISARDVANTALSPVITLQASTILTVGGTPTARTVGTASVTNLANNSNQGSAIITVAGPVRVIKVVITTRGGDPVFWMSDMNGCVTGSFPNNWRNISRPFTGMAPYILTVVNNNFMMLNPLNGRAKPLFTDPGWTNVNGMAYDPVNRELYYTFSLMPTSVTNKTIWKYDVDNETIGTLVGNVTTALNIPTYDQGVESGSASYYDGYYYFGVESSNSSRTSGRENTVWRIEFDATQTPVMAAQVYATRSDSAISGTNTLIHDWSDIGVTNNAMMYDFDGASSNPHWYHFNLMTGQRTQYTPSGTGINIPRQLAIDWAENVYNQGNISLPSPSNGFIVPYNYNGTVNAAQNYTVLLNGTPPSGSWGDCSEAFRPLCDFGDAPASYDPDPWSPAVHERDTALRLGPTFDREWNKTSSALADADGSDEDGLAYVPIFTPGSGTYLAQVSLYNNTGVDATVVAWLDFNGNGYFDAGEACAPQPPVTSSATMQTRNLYWPSAPSTLPWGSFTYLRIRLTKASNNMTANNSTGYYEEGETEDYRVVVDDTPLQINLLSFNTTALSKTKIQVNWKTAAEKNVLAYEIERSADKNTWQKMATVSAKGNGIEGESDYIWYDHTPLPGKSYYRLKIIQTEEAYKFSEIRRVILDETDILIKIMPNPASSVINLSMNSSGDTPYQMMLIDAAGKTIRTKNGALTTGANNLQIPVTPDISDGYYYVQVVAKNKNYTAKLIIRK
jgi:hypothetical protein